MIYINKLEFEKFKDDLSILSEESSSQQLLDIIKKFLISNEEFFSEKPYSDYKLLGFLDYNDNGYPINYSSLNKSEIIVFKKIINSYKHNEGENITRFLRDTLERLYYFEVDETCKNCGAYGLIAIAELNKNIVQLECRQCGCIYDLDGHVSTISGFSVPATIKNLLNARLI